MLKNNFLDNSVQDKTNITVVMKTKTPSWCQKLDVSWKRDWPLEYVLKALLLCGRSLAPALVQTIVYVLYNKKVPITLTTHKQ